MQSKTPASVMVFAAVASDGKVMPPHSIEDEEDEDVNMYI